MHWAISKLNADDLFVIKSIDRLGRNYDEILEQWRIITKEIRADIVVLDMPLLDTRKQPSDLTGTFIADLVLQILSYVAQTEREFIKHRQVEKIGIAKANGVKFGRKAKKLPPEFDTVRYAYESRKMSLRPVAKYLGMSKSTFYRRFRMRLQNIYK